MYYNYHARIKNLIKDGHLIDYKFVSRWRNTCPALVLFFDNHRPMPIKKERWQQYAVILGFDIDKINLELY